MNMRMLLVGTALAAGATTVGCGGADVTAPATGTTELLSVTPTGGSTGVSRTSPMTLRFSHPMMAGMEQFIDLHQGDAAGPLVPISCAWSADRTTVTCAPAEPLQAHTAYTLHMGAGMMDADGHAVDLSANQSQCGGQWLMPTMMGGMHAGAPMSGMGDGWHGTNGSYGMVFPFTTG